MSWITPIRNPQINLNSLEDEIENLLPLTIADMPLVQSTQMDHVHTYVWEKGDRFIEFTLSARIDELGAPIVYIHALKAAKSVHGLGVATLLLQPIVNVLQKAANPLAQILLEAWTGYNSIYRQANGAYTWSKLGFDIEDIESYPKDMKLSDIKLDLARRVHSVFMKNWDDKFTAQIEVEAMTQLSDAKYPWEIAEICVEGLSIGKALMSQCDESRYRGNLFPNQPDSPGMIQYAKRVQQFVSQSKITG